MTAAIVRPCSGQGDICLSPLYTYIQGIVSRSAMAFNNTSSAYYRVSCDKYPRIRMEFR